MTLSPSVDVFMAAAAASSLLEARDAIRAAVERGDGFWLAPPPEGSTIRPATHMVEIQLYGILAHGLDELDAVNNWLRIARREVSGCVA